MGAGLTKRVSLLTKGGLPGRALGADVSHVVTLVAALVSGKGVPLLRGEDGAALEEGTSSDVGGSGDGVASEVAVAVEFDLVVVSLLGALSALLKLFPKESHALLGEVSGPVRVNGGIEGGLGDVTLEVAYGAGELASCLRILLKLAHYFIAN